MKSGGAQLQQFMLQATSGEVSVYRRESRNNGKLLVVRVNLGLREL